MTERPKQTTEEKAVRCAASEAEARKAEALRRLLGSLGEAPEEEPPPRLPNGHHA